MPAAQHLIEAVEAANLTPAELIDVAAAALAEQHCTCSEMLTDTCPACAAAKRLADQASEVDGLPTAVVLIREAAASIGASLGDLIPGMVGEMLDRRAAECTCTNSEALCPVCSAARELLHVSKELLAVSA